MNHSNVVTSVLFLKQPDDIGGLPVLTDVLVPTKQSSGKTLWLAWDERRVPVLGDVVEAPQSMAYAPMRLWRNK
jgi:hypothetical protein